MVTPLKTHRKTSMRLKTSRRQQRRRRRRSRGERPTIRFTPFAWSKLLFLRDCGDTEVSGFGIHATDDMLLIEDVRLVTQQCTAASVQFSDAAAQDVFDHSADILSPDNHAGRIWIHTHPGDCARPSDADEKTFARCCSSVPWAVMIIIAANGDTYARLQFNIGPRCSRRLFVEVDYRHEFQEADFAGWKSEYDAKVEAIDPLHTIFDRQCRLRRSLDPNFGLDLQDPQVRAAVTSEWLAHCDAVPLFEDDATAAGYEV